MVHHNGTNSPRVSTTWLLREIQNGETFVYCIETREGAIKFGMTGDLAKRKTKIEFGGTERYLGFRPGDHEAEKKIHSALSESRIPGTREYYYPRADVVPMINALRDWMGVEPITRRDLRRMANCSFHGRVAQAQACGTSVFG